MISTGKTVVPLPPAPEFRVRPSKTRPAKFQPSALQLTGLYSCLILILLQLWRPFYFLGDDSLIFWLPIVTTMGERLWHAQSPAFNPYLFGGYNLLGDPTLISLWNPLVLGLSLLGPTRFYLAIIDIFCSVNLLLCSLGFSLLLCRLRDRESLKLSDGRLVFLSLSFTFSAYALSIGACWLMFLANPVCLSILMLGLLCDRPRPSVGLIAAGFVFGILVGHLSPLLYTILFFTLFAGGLCWTNRSWQPLQCWFCGIFLALVLVSPILWPAAQGFLGSSRSVPYSLYELTKNNVPATALFGSFFLGYIGVFLGTKLEFFSLRYIYGLSSCAASFLFFGGLPRGKKLTRLEISVGVVALIVALFLVRPNWLGALMSHIPLYRSLRWPFRETFLFLFFAHLWMALRPVTMSPRAYAINNCCGAALFAVSLLIVHPWSFSPMKIDRHLLISGQADAYWKRLKPSFGPKDRLIAIADAKFTDKHHNEIPYSLLGAFNYPALFKVASVSGYTAQGLSQAKIKGAKPYFLGSVYSWKVGREMMAKNPHLKALHLVSLHPTRIDFCSAAGCRAMALPPF